jgi:hypothetical protein
MVLNAAHGMIAIPTELMHVPWPHPVCNVYGHVDRQQSRHEFFRPTQKACHLLSVCCCLELLQTSVAISFFTYHSPSKV